MLIFETDQKAVKGAGLLASSAGKEAKIAVKKKSDEIIGNVIERDTTFKLL